MDNKRKTSIKYGLIHRLLRENEPDANVSIALIFLFISGLFFASWVVMQTGYYIINETLTNYVLLGNGSLFLLTSIITLVFKGKSSVLKYLFLSSILIAALTINMMAGFKVWLLFSLPIILSCRYFNIWLTRITGVFTSVFIVLGAYFNGYVLPYQYDLIDLNTVSYNEYTVLITNHSLYKAVLESNPDSYTTFINTIVLYTIPNILIIIVVTFACSSVVKYGQKIIWEENERNEKESKMKIEYEKHKQRMMMSQIQPHFLFNCLSSIMAIDNNPPETVTALGEFGKYLRGNLDSLTSEELVPFDKELQYVKRYIYLEKLRFKDNLQVKYNINTTDFQIPILTVQMLSENAVKHGITKKEDGGTLKISTFDIGDLYQIVVEDDGVGFDDKNISTDRSHIGLKNTKTRVENLCNGTINIESKPDVGTKIIITIPKGETI